MSNEQRIEGVIASVDTGYRVTLERPVEHDRETVWAMLTESAKLAQ